ncbi:ankyrin repeat domain-containing protein [Amphritea japonica]|uniref:CHAT domain-containing protein n=2 Tax=Amphritea TaxID=515417 RepID=A0A7R6SSX5_9GAMM|nr:ankyrin repeat domain-containing protein [Amphritea japonica]BBB26731.1 conserved hypothetical protein [Amphritea japonica ATCC BAA-1530]
MLNCRDFISFVCGCLLLTGSASATELVGAAVNQDLERVEQLIQQGVDLNVLDEEEGLAALHVAVLNNDLKLARLLLENGADINLKTMNQYSPIHIGAQAGSFEVIEYLVQLGIDINTLDGDGDSVLQHALYGENVELSNWLLDQGVVVTNKRSEDSFQSPLFMAVQLSSNESDNKQLYSLIEKTVSLGAGLNEFDGDDHQTPLQLAIQTGDLDLVKLLVTLGADVNFKAEGLSAPIHIAAQESNKIFHYLIDAGADLNVLDGDGDSVLQHALFNEQIELATWLLDQGVSVVSKGNENSYGSPLFLALQLIDNESDNKQLLILIEKIVSLGADLNAFEGDDNQTSLQRAAQSGNLDLVKLLVMLGSDVNLKTAEQSAPIHLAAEENSEVFQYLIQAGADINTLDVNGASLLQVALLHGEIEVASWLLDKGVDINSRGLIDTESENDGWSEIPAYDYPVILLLNQIVATDDNQTAITLLQKMISKGANLDVIDRDGSAFVFALLKSNNQPLIDELLPIIKQHDVTDSFDNSLLHAAIKNDQVNYAASLIRNGKGLAQADKVGYTPVHSAYEKGLFDIVALILEHENSHQMLSLKGESIFLRAYRDGHHKELKQWLAATSGFDIPDINGDTLLHEVVRRNDAAYVRMLLSLGADTGVLNDAGRSPFMLAIENESPELLTLLLGAAKKGNTSLKNSMLLHEAARLGSLEIVKVLIDAGISEDSRDDNGYLPAQIAVHFGQQEVLDYLVDLLEEPAVTNMSGTTSVADARLEYWSLLYWANKKDKLIKSIEQDLRSENSSIFAPLIWVEVQNNNGNLKSAYDALEGVWKSKLVVTAEAELNKDYRQLVAQYPPSYPFVESDVMALIDLAFVADKLVNKSLKMDYLEVAARLLPDFWQIAWMYNDSELVANTQFKARMQKFSASEGIRGTLVGSAIRDYSHTRSWERPSLEERSRNWLKRSPSDWRALAANSKGLSNSYRYEQAQAAAQKAATVSPFYFNFDRLPKLLLKQGKNNQAENHTALIARMYYKADGEPVASKERRYLASSFRVTGDKGRARQVLEDALQQMPDVANLHNELAKLEIADNRYAEAVDAMEKVFQLSDEIDSDDYKRYISALKQSGDSAEATRVAEQGLAQLTFIPEDFYIAVLELASAMEQDALIDRVYQLAVNEYPDSISLGKFHVERLWINDKQAALKSVEELLEQRPSRYDLIQLWKTYAKELNEEKQLLEIVREKVETYDWSRSWWQVLVDLKGDQSDAAALLWREANQRNNNTYFACDKLVELYAYKRHDYDRGQQLFHECLSEDETTVGLPARNRVLSELFWLVKEKSKKQRVAPELLDLAEGYLREYRDNFGELTRYYEFLESIARARNDSQSAANALALRADLLKDNSSIYHDLVSEYADELTENQIQGYGFQMLHRNPYSTDVLGSYLHKQLYWRGSPINALRAIESAKEKGISYDVSYERRALNELGDTLKLYESYYIGAIDPGASKRYINWFDNARNQALNGERKEVIYDFNNTNSAVRIVLPNGEIVTRQDHPVFGKVTGFKKGTSFLDVKYNENGNLQSIRDSSGRVVELKYNATHNIESMTDGERVIEFAYNDNDQPVLISIVGSGRLYIEYDEQGEITETQSEQGHLMALNITQAFQRLLSLTREVQRIHNLDDLPALAGSDIEYDRLKDDYFEAEEGTVKEIKAKMALVEYLVSHVTDNSAYFDEASALLVEIFTSKDNQSEASIAYTARVISLWYELHKEFKPLGLPQDDFEQWSTMKTWLVGVSFKNKKYENILNRLNEEPLVLLKDAKWLVTSDIQNTGFWRRYDNSELYSSELKGAQKQALLVRNNGDILVGTDKGLAVLNDGFWQWFGYDANQARLSRTASVTTLDTTSNILSLAETEDGVLWIGSANGLLALDGDYQSLLKRWRTKSDGLKSPRINVLKASKHKVYVGSADGLVSLTYSDDKATVLGGVSGNILDVLIAGEEGNRVPVILTENNLVLLDDSDVITIADRAVSIAYNERNNALYWLKEGKFYTANIQVVDEKVNVSGGEFIALKSDLLHSKKIHEMNIWPVEGEGHTLVINSDLGINVFNEYYFQSMPLPFELGRGGQTVGPEKSTVSENGDIVVATSDGIYAYQPSNVQQYKIGRVYDTLVDDSLGITYIATGSEILYIDHAAEDKEPKYFSSANAKYLRQDAQGNLITNDGSQILRFKQGEESAQQLFSTMQNVEGDRWGNGSLNDIFVDSSQNIWAAAGSSVFRYQEGVEEAEEYNYFIDAEKFPSRSQMIYRVYEDLDGKIKVIASNERHLSHQGVDLSGGVLEWQGDSFINLDEHSRDWLGNKHWFVTGYTKINEDTAIVSTNRDFAREKNGRRESFSELNDPTYKAMQEKSSMIWLGQKGARLGESNTWLFPSAGGVTVYHEGQWFYPDRLNQLLPNDQSMGQYGARTVHTVSVDEVGNIYVGTDIGLLVYESQGVASLLNDNHRGQVAFVDFDLAQQQEVRDVFLSQIKPETEQGKLVRRYQQLQGEIADIESRLLPGSHEDSGEKATDIAASEPDSAVAEKFKAQLKARERSRQKLLANLERNHYGLFQMLKMDPREIAAMHKKLDERQALIQYMPTKDKLLIQVVTNSGAVIRQVDVSKKILEQMSLEASAILREQTLQIGVSTSDRGAKRTDTSSLFNRIKVKGDSHINHLAWLYHHLIRPVENDLEGKDQVFITPVGALTYVPFSALIRQVTPNIEYAVERYNIGILPSMYHFNLVMHHSDSFSDGGLFIADPDGSLPGARQEVSVIADTFGEYKTIIQGEQASIDNIVEELDGSRVIHFATHGVLNTESPEDSYLLLANKYQLNVIDISMLDLEQTDLVVLSACESGIGNSGLEYATLARAFAHAKVPAVVASYWKVHDDATKELMTSFYAGLAVEESDNFSAMSSAMKSMISSRTKFSHPAAWAGFGVFGKP